MIDTGPLMDRLDRLTSGARDTAGEARQRMGQVYGQVRAKATDAAVNGRSLANDFADAGGQQAAHVVATSRKAIDRATLASRGLIAERPITAVIAGIAAGAVLGFLANRLGKANGRPADDVDHDDADAAGA